MNADWNLATTSKGGKRGTLRGHCEARGGIIKKRECLDGCLVIRTGLDSQRALARSRAKHQCGESVAKIFRPVQAFEARM